MFISNFEYLKIKTFLYTVYFTDDENVDAQCLEKEILVYNETLETANENTDINMGKKFNYIFIF